MDYEATSEQLEAGRGYEALFVPALFAAWTKHLVDGAEIGEGAHVLDVACGTGVLARQALAATGKTGHVAGVDPAPGMIAVAAEVEPGIQWVQGNAEALDFGDAIFDCVVSQFGMMFFEDRAKAAKEMFRVLKPGGRLAVAVWNSIDANPAYGDVAAILDEEVGTAAGNALRLPFSLGNPDDVTSVFDAAGFENVACDTRAEQARFATSRMMVEAELRGWLPLFDIILDEDVIADVLAKSDEKLAKHVSPSGGAAFPTSAHVITARKPV